MFPCLTGGEIHERYKLLRWWGTASTEKEAGHGCCVWEMLRRSSRTNGREEDGAVGDGGCEAHPAFSPQS